MSRNVITKEWQILKDHIKSIAPRGAEYFGSCGFYYSKVHDHHWQWFDDEQGEWLDCDWDVTMDGMVKL